MICVVHGRAGHISGLGRLEYTHAVPRQRPDALTHVERDEGRWGKYDTARPQQAIAWNRPLDVRLRRSANESKR